MESTTVTSPHLNRKPKVCFSFAAYSKELISYLHHHSTIPIATGLTETELTTIESTFNFSFPPDLRSILREGLPVGHGFPNWRSSSPQQLDILINFPILGLCKEVHRKRFWHRRWGPRPVDDDKAVDLAKGFLKKIPILVPVYRNCYISTNPCLSGNPVFYVNGLDVKLCSYDVVGFFQQNEFDNSNDGVIKVGDIKGMKLSHFLSAPVWAATAARRVEFWSEMVELRRGWWGGGSELGKCLEDVRLKLRNGGWNEDDVDDMMMLMEINGGNGDDVEDVGWHVKELSRKLLGAGWSRGDVVESLGCLTEIEKDEEDNADNGGGDEYCLFDFNGQSKSGSLKPVLEIHAINNNSIVV